MIDQYSNNDEIVDIPDYIIKANKASREEILSPMNKKGDRITS